MANFMQVSVSLPNLQFFKSVFLNIYNCAWKPGFLKSSHKLHQLSLLLLPYGMKFSLKIIQIKS